jgi:hypothetical protein
MGRKKVKDTNPQPTPQQEMKNFEYGDLVVACKCGQVQYLEKGVQHGVQLMLVPREGSFIKLACDKCESEISLKFIEGTKPEEPITEETNEGVQEENKENETV